MDKLQLVLRYKNASDTNSNSHENRVNNNYLAGGVVPYQVIQFAAAPSTSHQEAAKYIQSQSPSFSGFDKLGSHTLILSI